MSPYGLISAQGICKPVPAPHCLYSPAARNSHFPPFFISSTPLTRANDGIRTRDLLITNQLLYQLSYIGVYLLNGAMTMLPFRVAGKRKFFRPSHEGA